MKLIVVIILQYIFVSNHIYTLNLQNIIYQLHFSKVGEKYFETEIWTFLGWLYNVLNVAFEYREQNTFCPVDKL